MVNAESICGKCGYPTQGLPGLTCPECGSDLREVGITHRGARRGATILGPIWAITLLVFVPGLILGGIFLSVVYHQGLIRSGTFTPLPDGAWSSKITSIKGTVSSDGLICDLWPLFSHVPSSSIKLDLATPGGTTVTLHVDANGYCDQPAKSPRPLDADCVKQWLAAAGIDSRTPASRELISGILELAPQVRQNQHQQIGFVDFDGYVISPQFDWNNPTWIDGIPFLACIVIWIYLLISQGRQRGEIARGWPHCANCGIGAVGIKGVNCPNCFSDLRLTGIYVGREYPLTGTSGNITLYTCYLTAICTVASVLIGGITWEYRSDQDSILMAIPDQERAPDIQFIDLSATSHDWGWRRGGLFSPHTEPVPLERAELQIQARGHRTLTAHIFSNGSFHYVSSAGTLVTHPLDQPVISNWLNGAGLRNVDGRTDHFESDLLSAIRESIKGNTFQMPGYTGGGSSGSSNSLAVWALKVDWLIFLAIWLFLVRRILKKRRRDLEVEAATQAIWRQSKTA